MCKDEERLNEKASEFEEELRDFMSQRGVKRFSCVCAVDWNDEEYLLRAHSEQSFKDMLTDAGILQSRVLKDIASPGGSLVKHACHTYIEATLKSMFTVCDATAEEKHRVLLGALDINDEAQKGLEKMVRENKGALIKMMKQTFEH